MKIIRIGAIWCPSCLLMNSRWDKVINDYPNIIHEYLDYDENEELIIKKYQVGETLPVYIFLDNNSNEIDRITGNMTSKELITMIERYKDY